MNNTKTNRFQSDSSSKKANSGHSCANKIWETTLYSLEGFQSPTKANKPLKSA